MPETPATECVFCRIADGRAPATIVRDLPEALAIVPLNPVVDGHLLVLPRVHAVDFTDSPLVTARTMRAAAQIAADIGGPMNLITSKGREATQSVFHLHVHLVPRAKDDGLALPWYSGKGGHR